MAVVLLGPRRLRRPALGSLAVLAVAQSAMFAHTMLPVSERENMYPVTRTHRYLQQHLGEERFGSSGTTLYPATATYYRLRTPVGHEFTAARWWDLLRPSIRGRAVTPTYSLFPSDLSAEDSARMPLLDQLAVRYWVGRTSDVAGVTGPTRASDEHGGPAPSRGRALRGRRWRPARCAARGGPDPQDPAAAHGCGARPGAHA